MATHSLHRLPRWCPLWQQTEDIRTDSLLQNKHIQTLFSAACIHIKVQVTTRHIYTTISLLLGVLGVQDKHTVESRFLRSLMWNKLMMH